MLGLRLNQRTSVFIDPFVKIYRDIFVISRCSRVDDSRLDAKFVGRDDHLGIICDVEHTCRACQVCRRHLVDSDILGRQHIIPFLVKGELQVDNAGACGQILGSDIACLGIRHIDEVRRYKFVIGKHVDDVVAGITLVGHVEGDIYRPIGVHIALDANVVDLIVGHHGSAVAGEAAAVTVDGDLDIIDVAAGTGPPLIGIQFAIEGNDAEGAV